MLFGSSGQRVTSSTLCSPASPPSLLPGRILLPGPPLRRPLPSAAAGLAPRSRPHGLLRGLQLLLQHRQLCLPRSRGAGLRDHRRHGEQWRWDGAVPVPLGSGSSLQRSSGGSLCSRTSPASCPQRELGAAGWGGGCRARQRGGWEG